jgi:lysophospholipase L1-like esterase
MARSAQLKGVAMVAILAVVWTIALEAIPVVGMTTSAGGGGRFSVATPLPGHTRAAYSSASSSHGSTAVTSVVGLGDSVPAGSACDCDTFISLVGQALATRQGREVTSNNLATGGLTTQGLLDQLDGGSATDAIVNADLVIITIGANDFDSSSVEDADCSPSAGLACYKNDLAQLRANMDAILGKVRALQTRPGSRIVVTGYWNVFLDGDIARAKGSTYVANSDALTIAVNQALAEAAAAKGARYVDIYSPFKGDSSRDDTPLLAADGDHPNATGHQVIASSVLSALAME